MGMFHERKQFSGTVARERLATLLSAERLACSPRNIQMLKNQYSIHYDNTSISASAFPSSDSAFTTTLPVPACGRIIASASP